MPKGCAGYGQLLTAGRSASTKSIHLRRWCCCCGEAGGFLVESIPKVPHTHRTINFYLRKLTVTMHHLEFQRHELTESASPPTVAKPLPLVRESQKLQIPNDQMNPKGPDGITTPRCRRLSQNTARPSERLPI